MISSEVLEGVPLLVLANKQDVPVLYDRKPMISSIKNIANCYQIICGFRV